MNEYDVKIVLDYDELTAAFPDYAFPFSLKNTMKEIRKGCGIKYVTDEIFSELIKDPDLKSVALLTSPANKNARVYKMRISRGDNKGKSNGYRVILLLVTSVNTAFVLDIMDHKKGQDDLTNEQKNFCNRICEDIDEAIKGK